MKLVIVLIEKEHLLYSIMINLYINCKKVVSLLKKHKSVYFFLNLFCQFPFRFIKKLMKEAGLSVREDAVGNIFGQW